jgi:hypothetical protein
MRKIGVFLLLLMLDPSGLRAQTLQTNNEDAFFIRKLYDLSLTSNTSYEWLTFLCKKIGARISGSPQAAAAVQYTKEMLDTLSLDSVWLQAVKVPHWYRGEKERVRIVGTKSQGDINLRALSLGNSIGTGPEGLTAEVLEVQSLDELDELGSGQIARKVVFFNRPMDPRPLNTFNAYGAAADQRGSGAARAAKYGAAAVLVRSLTNQLDGHPHTGGMSYQEGIPQIPALAISTLDAEILSDLLKKERVNVYIRNTSRMLSEKESFNVIGEIKGSEYPDQIIMVGGHLDSWDVGEGAHDDGAGCVQSMEVLHLLKKSGYKPKRTIRCVLFMNEENGLRGGREYAAQALLAREKHLAAIESDRGGFTPRGFTCESAHPDFEKQLKRLNESFALLESYGLFLKPGGSGADIGPLKPQGVFLVGFEPDSQRYFDFHHTETDVLEAVNPRELKLGSASMAGLIYLMDKFGL